MPQIKQLLENNERIYPVTPASAVFFGDQSRLSDKVFANNGVLTIQKNGVTIGTFSANASTNSTINITTSDSDALAALFASVSYDSTNKKIEFFNTSNTKVGELDATAFIKDGMVSDVRIETPSTGPNAGEPCLIIDFNTDAEGEGKTDIEIPLSGIFDPDNYYTKTQADNKFLTIAAYTADEQVISASLNDLDSRVSTNTAAISALQQSETYTTAEKTKLAGIETGAEANVIEEVQVNGTPLTITNKAVNVDLSDYLTVSDYESDEEVIAESLNDLNTRLNDTVSQQDFQTFSQSIEDDFLLKETYAADERVVAASLNDLNTRLDSKQDKLVSGTSIKTVNNQSLLGSGNIELVDTDTLSENEKVTAAALLDLHDKADEHDARLDSLQEQIYPVPELTKQVGELQSGIVWIPGNGQNSAVLRGSNSVASGTNSVAEGNGTLAFGANSHAEGSANATSGTVEVTGIANATQYSVNDATNLSIGTVIVYNNTVRCITAINGTTITVIATLSDTALSAASCEYYNAGAFGSDSHVEGLNTIAAFARAHAEGNGSKALQNYTHAEGQRTVAMGSAAHAEGIDTTASGNVSHAEGQWTVASANRAHAEGWRTTASGIASHAEGYQTTASGNESHAEGYNTEANGIQSHSGGYLTIADGDLSFVHGTRSDATTTGGIALGFGSHIYSSSSNFGGFAWGASCSYDINPVGSANATTYTCTTNVFEAEMSDAQVQQIFGNCIIWNNTNNATIPMAKITSLTVNSNTDNTRSITFTTDRTLSETALDGTTTFHLPGTIANYWGFATDSGKALGGRSIAMGRESIAKGSYSTAIGSGTIVRNDNEVATGKYNVSTSGHTNFSVGVGTESARANMIEITDNSNLYIKGIGGYDGTNYSTASSLQSILGGSGGSFEQTTNKVTSLSASSTDTQYPSAKCVYDLIGDIETVLDTIINGSNAS